jgi:hypothetical protein
MSLRTTFKFFDQMKKFVDPCFFAQETAHAKAPLAEASSSASSSLSIQGIPEEMVFEILQRLMLTGNRSDLSQFSMTNRKFHHLITSFIKDEKRHPKLVRFLDYERKAAMVQKLSRFFVSKIPTLWRGRSQEDADYRRELLQQATMIGLCLSLMVAGLSILAVIHTDIVNDDSTIYQRAGVAALLLFGMCVPAFTPATLFICTAIIVVGAELFNEMVERRVQNVRMGISRELTSIQFVPGK